MIVTTTPGHCRDRPLSGLWSNSAWLLAALVGAAVSWSHARHTVAVAPIADGQPFTTSLVYDPQQLLLTMLLLDDRGGVGGGRGGPAAARGR